MATLEELIAEKKRRESGAQPNQRLAELLAEKDRRSASTAPEPAPTQPPPKRPGFTGENPFASQYGNLDNIPQGVKDVAGGLGRQAGLTARATVEGVLEIPSIAANAVAGVANIGMDVIDRIRGRDLSDLITGEGEKFRFKDQAAILSGLLTQMGVPEAEAETEKIVQRASKNLINVATGLGAGRALAKSSAPVVAGVGEMLTTQPIAQAVGAATGPAAGKIAEEMGAGPITQGAAELVGAVLPGVGNPFRGGSVKAAQQAASGSESKALAVADQAAQEAAQTQSLAAATKKASSGGVGSSKALKVLAEGVKPDKKAIEAAKRLGIDEYLQADHVSTNQVYREIAQAVKSIPGSTARTAELQGYERIFKRANDLIEEVGGTNDLSRMESRIGANMRDIQDDLWNDAEMLYAKVRQSIPAKTDGPADNVLSFINNRADELGGVENLTPIEKTILKRLTPMGEGEELTEPTYALLDDTRKRIGSALGKKEGEFATEESGMLKKLYELISDDQHAVADALGQGETLTLAKASVQARKALEDDMVALFGKKLDQSLIQKLTTGTKKLASGDIAAFRKVLKAIPDENRKEFVASALNVAFGKNARNGNINFTTYSDFYEGLLRNKEAYAALMENLPKESRKMLSDLYRVSSGIRKASRERVTTGRINSIKDQLQGADSLISKVYEIGKRAIPMEAVTSAAGLPGSGVGAAVLSSLSKNKTPVIEAADKLITSKPFLDAVQKQSDEAVRVLASSAEMQNFIKLNGGRARFGNPVLWIQGALGTTNEKQTEEISAKTLNVK